MKGIAFILAMVVCLIVFGVPILACFMSILAIGLGIGVDAALTVGMVLTVVFVVVNVARGLKD
jgi:hypothetical protein